MNTCPVGIATQDPKLRKLFRGKPEHVVNYLNMVAEETRQIMAELGISRILDLIGRVELLQVNDAITHWKADGLDLTSVLTPAVRQHENVGVFCTMKQDHGLKDALDNKLIELSRPAILEDKPTRLELDIINTNRTVGTMLSNYISLHKGEAGLPADQLHIKLNGSAGQSFGAFLAHGVTLELEGDSNDYVGKGLSGGRLMVYPPRSSSFKAEDEMIVGNVCLYGATGGEAFFRGRASERFCVRNSGATAVVEGVGDHGCEYMTGGRTVILGQTGRNFAAGMSGGIAYVWDPEERLLGNCNLGTVELEKLEEAEDIQFVHDIIGRHIKHTGSTLGRDLLDTWDQTVSQFVKVMPVDYKRALMQQKEQASS